MECGFRITRPAFCPPLQWMESTELAVEHFKTALTPDQFLILMHHATCLACLDGNVCIDETIPQYCLDAYVNLWQNSHVGDGYLPNLFPMKAGEFYSQKG